MSRLILVEKVFGCARGAALLVAVGLGASACGSDGGESSDSPGTDSGGASAVASGAGGVFGSGGLPAPGGGAGTAGATAAGGGIGTGPDVVVPNVACGVQSPHINVTIGGRSVILDYPCAPAGTPVTFILNLHGTAPADTEDAKTYMRYYLPLYLYTQSHRFVIASPRAIGVRWEEDTGAGQDLPHLLEVMQWVHDNLGGADGFDIRSTWVTGHSWGAVTGFTFVCRDDVSVDGYIHMSGGPLVPDCGDRLSLVGTHGETDFAQGLPDQNAIAAAHGCDPATSLTIGGNDVTDWPSCDPGFAHRNYVFLGKGHGFVPDDWPDEAFQDDVADLVRSTRLED